MNKTTYIVIGVVAVALLLFGFSVVKSPSLGGLMHNNAEQYSAGIVIGSSLKPACIKVADTDVASGGGFSYITYLNGVETVTGGTLATMQGQVASYQWTIPTACVDAKLVDIQAR